MENFFVFSMILGGAVLFGIYTATALRGGSVVGDYLVLPTAISSIGLAVACGLGLPAETAGFATSTVATSCLAAFCR